MCLLLELVLLRRVQQNMTSETKNGEMLGNTTPALWGNSPAEVGMKCIKSYTRDFIAHIMILMACNVYIENPKDA